MFQNSNKTAFIRHENPDCEVAHEREKRTWMPHTVGLLVLSPKGDQLGMALPGTARRNDAEHVKTPPQLRMSVEAIKKVYRSKTTGYEKHIQQTAFVAAREFLNMTNFA